MCTKRWCFGTKVIKGLTRARCRQARRQSSCQHRQQRRLKDQVLATSPPQEPETQPAPPVQGRTLHSPTRERDNQEHVQQQTYTQGPPARPNANTVWVHKHVHGRNRNTKKVMLISEIFSLPSGRTAFSLPCWFFCLDVS